MAEQFGDDVALRKHGMIWAEFKLEEVLFGKSVRLLMKRVGSAPIILLELTVVGDQLLYNSAKDIPVLGGVTSLGKGDSEHAPKKSS